MDFHASRQNMVESQVRVNDVTDQALVAAMRTVRRERLCAPSESFRAYAEVEPTIAPERVLMAPRDVSKLLQTLEPVAGEDKAAFLERARDALVSLSRPKSPSASQPDSKPDSKPDSQSTGQRTAQ